MTRRTKDDVRNGERIIDPLQRDPGVCGSPARSLLKFRSLSSAASSRLHIPASDEPPGIKFKFCLRSRMGPGQDKLKWGVAGGIGDLQPIEFQPKSRKGGGRAKGHSDTGHRAGGIDVEFHPATARH